MKITVIGAGYVGLVTATCLSELGHIVHVINRDPHKTASINAGSPPIYEKGLDTLLKKNIGKTLFATTDYRNIRDSNLVFICVGTPHQQDGSADLSMVRAASRSIGENLAKTEHSPIIVVKSTVPPGTTEGIVRPIVLKYAGKSDISFAMNPEFLREGRAVEDFFHPDRIVIGCSDNSIFTHVASVYRNIDAPILVTSIDAAEMIKLVSNAFLATKISFSNEIGNICKRDGIDVYEVMKGVGMDERISPHFLNAGVGFGGSCFPKDVAALIYFAESHGEDPIILKSVMKVNEIQANRMLFILKKRVGELKGKRIAVLGLAFKDDTDDVRDSRAIPVISQLLQEGAIVVAFDPVANITMEKIFPNICYCGTAEEALTDADACLVMTEWPDFSRLGNEFERMKSKIVIEGRRILSYHDREGICW